MKDKEITVIKVRQTYHNNFVNIVLAVISIVQGLAFNDLAQRFTKIHSSQDWILIAHFILSFVLLLRIFQTYVTAALDYDSWDLGFIDIFTIFLAGLLEYLVFSTLVFEDFNVANFHRSFLILSILAFSAYLRAIIRLFNNRAKGIGVPRQYYKAEVRLQKVNLAAIAIAICISIYIQLSVSHIEPPSVPQFTKIYPASYIIFGFLIPIIMGFNIYYSLRVTFYRPKIDIIQFEESEVENNTSLTTAAAADKPDSAPEKIIETRKAEKKDADQLLTLLTDNFSYVYETIFNTNPELTKKIINDVLLARDGNHEWGYQGFHVAVDKESGEVLGLIKMETASEGINFHRIASLLILAIVLIRHIGLIGLMRTLKNLGNVQSAISPMFESNELYINYIAVDTAHRGNSIAKKLIDIACNKARDEEKDCVTLDTREENSQARKFFKKQGFSEKYEIRSEYDVLFQRGSRICMKKKL